MGLLFLFQERFGFTRTELIAVLALAAVFLAGSAMKLWGPASTRTPAHQAFSYAPLDSEFLALARTPGNPATAPRHSPTPKSQMLPALESIELNSATVEELQKLPGIGPALAARIVAYRESHGGFAAADEVSSVRGIGPRTLDRILPFLFVRSGPRNGTP